MSINLKFNILNSAILLFFLLSLFTSYELSKGAHLQRLNFNHVKYNNIFFENVMHYEENQITDLEVLRQDILRIREQPISCLKSVNVIEKLFMTAIKTDTTLDICIKDINDANRVFKSLGERENGIISKEAFLNSLHVAVNDFNENSNKLGPFVSKTVSALFNLLITSSIIFGALIVILAWHIIKAIKRDYKTMKDMSGQIKRLASFPEKSPHPILEINEDMEVTYANQSFKNTFPNLPLDERFTDEVFLRALNFTKKVFKEKAPQSFDHKLDDRWFNFYLSYVEIEGEPFARALIRNITHQKNTQEQLELTTKAANIGLWDWNTETNKTYFSDEWFTLLGYEPLELPETFETFSRLTHPDDFKEAMALLEKHIAGETEDYKLAIRMKHKEGHEVWLLTTGQVTERNEAGKPIRVSGIHFDITDRKKAEKEIEQSKKFQDLIMSHIPDFLFVKDKKFRIVQANPAFFSVYPEEMQDNIIGKTTLEKYAPKEAEEFLVHDKKALKDGYSETEETIQFPDGEVRVLFTKKVRFENAGKEKFVLGISRDITEKIKAERDLVDANTELEEFAYRTSHDLRAPIISSAALLDVIDKMLREKNIEDARAGIEHAKSSLDKLKTLIDDILQLTIVKRKKEEDQAVKVSDMIEVSIEKFSHMEGFDTLEIQKQLKFKAPLNVKRLHLTLIFENLFSNAIKYRDTKKEHAFIRITTSKSKNQFVLEITDNGLGIPKNQQKSVFKMFKRFHPKVAFGSGLGLYLIKKSADRIGAKIEFKDPGDGASFTLKIPLERENAS